MKEIIFVLCQQTLLYYIICLNFIHALNLKSTKFNLAAASDHNDLSFELFTINCKHIFRSADPCSYDDQWKITNKYIPCQQNKIDDVLPSMFKSLKIVLAGLHELTESLRSTDISSDANLSESLNKSVSDVRNVLCYFYVSIRTQSFSRIEISSWNILCSIMGYFLCVYQFSSKYLEYILHECVILISHLHTCILIFTLNIFSLG